MTYVPATDRYDRMQYRRSGRSGLQLPAVSLGLWHNFGRDRPYELGRGIARRAFDLGILHFDLANNYGPPFGSAEENFGRILSDDLRPYRDELIISTKAGYDMWPGPYGEWGSRKYLLASLDQSLARMGLEYVDLFYSHRFDPETPLEETIGALDTAVRQGKALYVGISSYSAAKTQEAAAIAQGMLTDRYLDGIPPDSRAAREGTALDSERLNEETLAKVRALNEVAASRGQSLAQMAIAWILRHQGVTSALIGASSVEQLEANVAALDRLDFSDDELAEIDRYATEADINLWSRSSSAE